ncbi:MAG TPA: SCP2 sterol-binding domain-containing protein, partial [Polyangiaceae bacterium]|nr:SCP2 sterol-binding domain-containing protein [Polyangiaceae bacterium]
RSLVVDRVLTASISANDFERLALGEALSEERPPLFIGQRMLRVDAQTLNLVRNVPGSILVRVADQEVQRRVLLTPGDRGIDFENAECAVECDHADLIAVRSGQVPPLELFLAGKLRVLGDAQLALALGGLFV